MSYTVTVQLPNARGHEITASHLSTEDLAIEHALRGLDMLGSRSARIEQDGALIATVEAVGLRGRALRRPDPAVDGGMRADRLLA